MERQRSIVRDGNHFIYLDGSGWVLIDGPWHRTLEAMNSHRYGRVMVPIPPKMNCSVIESDYAPTIVDIETFEWERVWWHPGGGNPFKTNTIAWARQQEVLHHRTRPGWKIKSDGRLPSTFNTLTLEQAQRSDWYL